MQIFVDQHGKAVDFKDIVGFLRFVQNHCQGRAGSPSGLQEHPDWRDLLFLEIILQNTIGFLRDVNHCERISFQIYTEIRLFSPLRDRTVLDAQPN